MSLSQKTSIPSQILQRVRLAEQGSQILELSKLITTFTIIFPNDKTNPNKVKFAGVQTL